MSRDKERGTHGASPTARGADVPAQKLADMKKTLETATPLLHRRLLARIEAMEKGLYRED